MYLVDTNVWLERLLDQDRSEEAGEFLGRVPSDQLFMTDFSLHSIGLILTRLGSGDVLLDFVQDTLVEGAVGVVRLRPEETERLVETISTFSLDYDDAYQYVVAENRDLTLVSFDTDFDATDLGRTAPDAAARG